MDPLSAQKLIILTYKHLTYCNLYLSFLIQINFAICGFLLDPVDCLTKILP